MGRFIDVTAADGHVLRCWHAQPAAKARGAVVVLQEIFGVNHHIQAVCERLAAEGHDAYAPALFDRIARDFTCGYSPDEVAQALKLLPQLDWNLAVADTMAVVQQAKQAGQSGSVALMGFCLGASVAWRAAQQHADIAAVVGYYGGQIAQHLQRAPQSPTLLHYGETDHTIPLADVDRIRAARPECEVHVYPAGHGFNCDERVAYEPKSAALAWQRSMDWLRLHLRGDAA